VSFVYNASLRGTGRQKLSVAFAEIKVGSPP